MLGAQAGFLVHLVALLLPQLAPNGAAAGVAFAALAAMIGRTLVGAVIDGLGQRRISAMSFVSQATALDIILAYPARQEALYAACGLFGLS